MSRWLWFFFLCISIGLVDARFAGLLVPAHLAGGSTKVSSKMPGGILRGVVEEGLFARPARIN